MQYTQPQNTDSICSDSHQKDTDVMVQHHPSDSTFPYPATRRAPRLFASVDKPLVGFPIQALRIDWDRLIAKCPRALDTIVSMPVYLLNSEVMELIQQEYDPKFRLILDVMWTTGARVSEVLALTPGSFGDNGYDFGVYLKTLKQGAGRPKKWRYCFPPSASSPLPIPFFRITFKAISGRGILEKPNEFFRWRDKPLIATFINLEIVENKAQASKELSEIFLPEILDVLQREKYLAEAIQSFVLSAIE